MVPAAVVDATLADLVARLAPDDIVVDGGNSYYRDDIERARQLAASGLHYVESGGAARRSAATSTAVRAAPATSSRWCTTASSTG
jgi:6-phosphogluconate dehydrogenase (decarboxylating)